MGVGFVRGMRCWVPPECCCWQQAGWCVMRGMHTAAAASCREPPRASNRRPLPAVAFRGTGHRHSRQHPPVPALACTGTRAGLRRGPHAERGGCGGGGGGCTAPAAGQAGAGGAGACGRAVHGGGGWRRLGGCLRRLLRTGSCWRRLLAASGLKQRCVVLLRLRHPPCHPPPCCRRAWMTPSSGGAPRRRLRAPSRWGGAPAWVFAQPATWRLALAASQHAVCFPPPPFLTTHSHPSHSIDKLPGAVGPASTPLPLPHPTPHTHTSHHPPTQPHRHRRPTIWRCGIRLCGRRTPPTRACGTSTCWTSSAPCSSPSTRAPRRRRAGWPGLGRRCTCGRVAGPTGALLPALPLPHSTSARRAPALHRKTRPTHPPIPSIPCHHLAPAALWCGSFGTWPR